MPLGTPSKRIQPYRWIGYIQTIFEISEGQNKGYNVQWSTANGH